MKKFVLSMMIALVTTMLINLPVSYARQVKFADCGAENFASQLKQILHSNEMQQTLRAENLQNMVITDTFREQNLDIPDKGLSAWCCYYGTGNSSNSYGKIILLSDSDGYVFEVKVVFPIYPDLLARAGSCMITCVFPFMSLTESEGYNFLSYSSAWSSYKNRRFTISRDRIGNEVYISFRAFDS